MGVGSFVLHLLLRFVEIKIEIVGMDPNWQKNARGRWSGFGTGTVGIDPNTFEVLNGHPNKIPTDKIL